MLPPPAEMGAPSKFTSWRPGQADALERALMSERRVQVLAWPTGIGKSLGYMTLAAYSGLRTYVLVSTKALQDQLLADFGDLPGLVDVRGMGNYPCLEQPGEDCQQGRCLDGWQCPRRDSDCVYYAKVRESRAARIVLTNYAYWMTQRRAGKWDTLGKVDLLVCDEAHLVAKEILDFASVELSSKGGILHSKWPEEKAPMEAWRRWAAVEKERVTHRLTTCAPGAARRPFREMVGRLERIENATGHWACEPLPGGVKLAPLDPAQHTEALLDGGVERVVFASATIRPKGVEQLGFVTTDYDFIECPSPFPARNRPIIHTAPIGTSVRLKYGAGPDELRAWAERADQIIDGRLDRRGLIHTVSYGRMETFLQLSRHKDRLIAHGAGEGKAAVARLRSTPGGVLVSPVMHTGVDFAGDLAEYQVIAKVPFLPAQSAIAKARELLDPTAGIAEAIQTLVQMTGRVVRMLDDKAETFIIDDNIKWLVGKYRHLFPRWWMDAYRSMQIIPLPSFQPTPRSRFQPPAP